MSDLTLSFSPLLPWPVLAALGVVAIGVLLFSLRAGRRGAALRLLALSLLLLALADPSLIREQRDPQKSIVLVGLDRSESQSIGERSTQTDKARAALEAAFGKLGDIEPRFFDYTNKGGDGEGTMLFSALEQNLKDVAPERVGAAILVTDGIVHDIPAKALALGFHRAAARACHRA